MKEQTTPAAVLKHSLRLLPLLGLSAFLSSGPSLRAAAPTPLSAPVKLAADLNADEAEAFLLHVGLSGSVPVFTGTPDGLRAGEAWMRGEESMETTPVPILAPRTGRTKAKQAASQPYRRSFREEIGEMFDDVSRQIEERREALLQAHEQARVSRYRAAKAARDADDSLDADSGPLSALIASVAATTPLTPVAGGNEVPLFQVDMVLARIGEESPTYGGTLTLSNNYSSPGNAATIWYGLPSSNGPVLTSVDNATVIVRPVSATITPMWNYTPVSTVTLPTPEGAIIKQGTVPTPQVAGATLTLAPTTTPTSSTTQTLQAAAGPTSTLYLTAGDQHRNWRVSAGTTSATSFAQATSNEYPISVYNGVIRTGGNGQHGLPDVGSTYDLNFNYTGTHLGNPANNVLDGTTDGNFNYGINWQTGGVYRYNLDWTSPILLFSPTMLGSGFGLTYSAANNSLWVGDAGGRISDYSMAGTLLSSFTNPGSENRALAYDSADGTLWTMTKASTGTLTQYTTGGTVLQTFNVGTLGDNIFGGEFAEVPEPTGATLLGLGCLTMAARRRRSKGGLATAPLA